MLCFEIHRNGQRVALAGVDAGVLSAVLSSVTRPGAAPELGFEVGGLVEGRHLYWAEESLQIGDRIELRIVEAETADGSLREHRESDEMKADAERRYYERLKAKYER